VTAVVDRAGEVAAAPAAHPGVRSVWRTVGARVGSTLGWFATSLVVLGALWEIGVRAFGLDAFGAKSASQVFTWLFLVPAARGHRAELGTALGTTAAHAGLGFLCGAGVGLLLALVLVVTPRLERPVMPLVLLTQALPILTVLPLFILVFGRGYLVTIVITTLAVFFPMFVLAVQGLRSVSAAHLDFFRSLDASRTTVLRRLRIPHAVPNVFAAARICVPSAMFGAIVSEWLATGDGLGFLMINAASSAGGYSELWSAVALTTVFTMAWYALVGVVEAVVLGRFAPEQLTPSHH
jgi:ABC-type nitrate/sulfonate/bicarbonate transport system permease component